MRHSKKTILILRATPAQLSETRAALQEWADQINYYRSQGRHPGEAGLTQELYPSVLEILTQMNLALEAP